MRGGTVLVLLFLCFYINHNNNITEPKQYEYVGLTVVEVYTDASVKNSITSIAFCVIEDGNLIVQHGEIVEASESIVGEFKAIIRAIELLDFEDITVFTDCPTIVEMVNGNATPNRDDLHGYLWRVKQSKASVKYVRRENNVQADRLARSMYG